MSGASNFLSRWSRRKRQAEEKKREADRVSPGEAEADASAEATGDLAHATGAELSPEELAALPRLEDLTPETDLAPFLRTGVPPSLRNAALRRMWTLDPAIRDRVGDALEYAYDWNVSGGVPGTGPLLASDDVQAMLRSIMNVPAAEPSTGPETPIQSAAVEQAPPKEPRFPVDSSAETAVELPAQTPAPHEEMRPVAEPPPKEPKEPKEPLPKEMLQVRRHGSATPF